MEFITNFSSSKGNLYQVKSETGRLLIDPGVPIAKIKKALDFKLNEITACLCSHHHRDHSQAIHDIAKAGIDCFMLHETAQSLKFNGHRLHPIEPLQKFEIEGFSLISVPIHHQDVRTGDRIPGVGFLVSDGVNKLLYFVDSFYCRQRFSGLTLIALGVNYSKKTMNPHLNPARKKRLYKSHMSLETAIRMLKANDLTKVREIHILHISSENGDPEYFKSEIMKATGKPVYVGKI